MVKLFGCEHVLFFKTRGKMTLKAIQRSLGQALVSKCEGGTPPDPQQARQWSSGTQGGVTWTRGGNLPK